MIGLILKKVGFRLRHALWRVRVRAYAPGQLHRFRLPGGLRFDYPLRSAIGEYLYAGSFEHAELHFVRSALQPGQVVLDVGANAGLYTVIAARAVGPGGQVYALEPGAEALRLLRHNLALNALDNVVVIEAAAAAKSGEAMFAVAADSAHSSLADVGRSAQQIQEWTSVRTLTLDDVVEQHGIGRVDFIKLDVEGAEKPVLEGASGLLARPAPLTLLFEGYGENAQAFGYTIAEMLEALRGLGFRISAFDPHLRLRPVEREEPGVGSVLNNFVATRAAPGRD